MQSAVDQLVKLICLVLSAFSPQRWLTILLRNWSYITEERDIADIRMQKQANDNL